MVSSDELTADQLMQVLEEVGAVITDSHLVFNSGRHGTAFVNWVDVLNDAKAARATSRALAEMLVDLDFEVIAGPTHTGDKLAFSLADALLDLGREVVPVYVQEITEKRTVTIDGKQKVVRIVLEGRTFPRGQARKIKGRQVLVIDDVLTTGGTIRETLAAVREASGIPIAVAVACNRSEFSEEFDGLFLLELLNVPMVQWEEEDCQACIAKVPMNTKVGHGKDWLEAHPNPSSWPAVVKDRLS